VSGVAADVGHPRGERARLVRRNTILLACCQGLAAITFPVLLIIGSVAIVEISGRDSSAGVMNGVYFLSAAGGAFVFGRAMDRLGRRAGLLAAYLLLGAAGFVCALGTAAESFPILLAGAVVFGAGFSGANLARAAVADMYEPSRRGRAVGIVLAVSTIGAVGSPFLIAAVRAWAEGTSFDAEVVAWFIVPVVALGAFACALALRPDPRDLSIVTDTDPGRAARSPSQLLAIPMFRIAVIAAAIGQMAMVAVMGLTPIALHHHDTSTTVIATVISLHIVGMWAFSPFIGWGLDRFGRKPGLLAGGAISVTGCLLAATDSGAGLVAIGLFAIGLGWSATFLGATALISDLTEPSERGAALGFNDLLVSLSSAIAGFAGGFVFEGAGFRVLGVAFATLVLVVMVAVLRAREPVPAVATER